LKNNIEELVKEKKNLNSEVLIGIKSVITEDNVRNMAILAKQALEMGINFIDFSCDFSTGASEKLSILVKQQVELINELTADTTFKVFVGGSLFKNNIFSNKPYGDYVAKELIYYKVFIDPAGFIVPFHDDAFPKGEKRDLFDFSTSLGRIGQYEKFEDIFNRDMSKLKPKSYKLLNPFELMLSLELQRRSKDYEDGISLYDIPYNI